MILTVGTAVVAEGIAGGSQMATLVTLPSALSAHHPSSVTGHRQYGPHGITDHQSML